ncbi:SLAM family member 6-like [Hypanus sabinus]|uniref:SLAM family member 6-like n=1 Tax=Hypanus sabinus TaxID=79690 RepID=UPI0028C44E8B|nr:SLAM family member 6-like [Hypanus sabinus]
MTLMICPSVSVLLAESDGNLATRRVVNGILGQSVTLPGNLPGESISFITWDYTNPSDQEVVQLCVNYEISPTTCNRKRMTLNLKDYSLEIQNLTDSDEGLYEISARTNTKLHKEVMELRIYEPVSTPVINISKFLTDEVCNISLHCLLERGLEPVYTWWTGGDEVTADESHVLTDGGRRLELSLRPSDNRVYNCTVRNPVSEATTSVDLRKLCPVTEGEKLLKPLHIRLIITIVLIASITIMVFTLYWKRELKFNKERIGNLAGDFNSQLKAKVVSFIAFSVAIDESIDLTEGAQLGIFIRGVDASLTVTEEFVEMLPMTNTTTANDVFSSLVEALDRLEFDWSHVGSVATDGAPSMGGKCQVFLRNSERKFRQRIQSRNSGIFIVLYTKRRDVAGA